MFIRCQKSFIAGFLVFLAYLLPVQGQAGVEDSTASALFLYGNSIEFDVIRNGSRIGTHRVRFTKKEKGLSVETRFTIEISVLFLKLYELDYQSDAFWQQGRLVSLKARTDKNGDISTVEAFTEEERLVVKGPNGLFRTQVGVYPTNHWNAGVIESQKLLNTITGRISTVRLEPGEWERVPTERGLVEARRYLYVGDIRNEVWYDRQGRWVHMRFPGDDESIIELHCRKCFPGATHSPESGESPA